MRLCGIQRFHCLFNIGDPFSLICYFYGQNILFKPTLYVYFAGMNDHIGRLLFSVFSITIQILITMDNCVGNSLRHSRFDVCHFLQCRIERGNKGSHRHSGKAFIAYYGKSAFRHMLAWLKSLPEDSEGAYCMAGFRLGNTLSDYGGVTRGICVTDNSGTLRQVTETRNIIKTPEGCAVKIGTLLRPVDVDACVSMNMWGFTPDILPRLEARFCTFLKDYRLEPKSEFLLPDVVDHLLADNEVTVKVLPTEDGWFGMTYQEDVPPVTEAFHKMAQQGIYKPGLY